MFEQVHHVCHIVDDMDTAIAFFRKTFGLELPQRFFYEPRDQEFALFKAGNFLLECIAPAPRSPRYQTVKERGGPFIDHVGYGVHDLDGAVAALKARGVALIGGGPRIAPTGWRVCNLEMKDTMGLNIQLVDLDHEG